ncbi:[acyl-carrier-protein] S-malonyltransferase [Prochlorococcus marinus str. MU1404]|uniref:ACP S-malonyltransferase n=1 Tax=Prochlorococcus marinus TaxID=1219 RepID=UPI001ADB26BE|nr:ACP S-malonyltransferase [Prochlorococcus marinus]MBO8229307.1 ACP S-malonyltransferase [Prochlorococcus marinus XMU1404]MBW3072390.1 [acyl-carrier-protein] S-malonyltransferase [Prochlorococcus marinus str. MU1404]MCR8544509.1 ACP S-malonyltransferase [Prochlorococcus marinus CUG1432]
MTVAWVFPGQGSQKIGMAKQIENLPNSKERFNYASEIFERNLFEICEFSSEPTNPLNDLNNTINTQICLFLVESVLLDALKDNGFKPAYVAGHSLGEITALYCADVFSFQDCVSLIKVRSQLMVNAGNGSMAAVIGFDRNQLNSLVKKIDDIVIANDNSSSQVVLSGSNEALDNLSTEISCKRFLKLNVSGAFHSPFMNEPSAKFSDYLKQIEFKNPSFPVISNYNPTLCRDPNELKIRLENQMCHGVRWRETMDLMAKDSDLHIVEIGPSNVLSGLGKRHLKDVKISQVSSSDQITY